MVNSDLVAVLHLVDVAADDAADDFLVERAAHVGLAGDDVWSPGPTTAETTGATTVARAIAAAAALADGAEVAETDGAFAGTTAAGARADETETADAVGLADFVADETAEHVDRIRASRRVATEDRGQVRALVHLEDAQDTGVLGVLFGQLLGQVRIGVVLRTLEAVQTLLVLGGLLAHLAFFALVALALAALLVGTLLLEPLGNLFFLLLRGLDEEVDEAAVRVEEVERERLRIRRNREDHEQEEQKGRGGADGVGLLAPAPDQERHGNRPRLGRGADQEGRRAAVDLGATAIAEREAGTALLHELRQRNGLAVEVNFAGHAGRDVDHEVGARRRHQRKGAGCR